MDRIAVSPSPISPRLAAELRRAAWHHQAGRLDRAEALYRRILEKEPRLVEAVYLLGAIAFDTNRHTYALQLAADALQTKPDFAPAHLLQGNALAALGRAAEAEAAWRRAAELAPYDPAAHVNLAVRYCQTGRADAALMHARQALAVDPALYRAHYAAGLALLELNCLSAAEASLAEARRLAPENVEILRAHARAQLSLGDADGAVATLNRALELAPRDAQLRLDQAEALRARGLLAEAETVLDSLLQDAPTAASWCACGDMLSATGRFDAAADAYRRALAADSKCAPALVGLTRVRSGLSAEEATSLKDMANQTHLPLTERTQLLHALGRHYETLGQNDAAFAQHAAAKALVRERAVAADRAFDAATFIARIDAVIANWTPAQIARLGANSPQDDRPVFIVGLPRSGSTLVEQIIASHPDAVVLGERMDIPLIAERLIHPEAPEQLQTDQVARFAASHLQKLRGLAGGDARVVVDKQLDNIFRLGLIGALFPRARVILCQRDLRDVGLSCYLQEFPGAYNEFLDLRDIAVRLLHTQRLAEHWLATPPLAMLSVQYELLVSDLEGQARRIIGFLKLPWNQACLEFHRTQRHIGTSSVWQARQPLYPHSVGRWREFERHIGPLLEVLG